MLKVIKNAIRSGLQVTVTKTPQGDSYQLFSFALQYYLLHLEGSHICDWRHTSILKQMEALEVISNLEDFHETLQVSEPWSGSLLDILHWYFCFINK